LTFLGEIFQIQTQTINGLSNLTQLEFRIFEIQKDVSGEAVFGENPIGPFLYCFFTQVQIEVKFSQKSFAINSMAFLIIKTTFID